MAGRRRSRVPTGRDRAPRALRMDGGRVRGDGPQGEREAARRRRLGREPVPFRRSSPAKAEADYLAEAANLKRYRRLVAASEPGCAVPEVHDDLTTERILAMERIEGIPFERFAAEGSRGVVEPFL